MSESKFNGKITIEQIVKSLDAFKSAIYNVNYVNKIIRNFSTEIRAANDYSSIIGSFVTNHFELSKNIFIVSNVTQNMASFNKGTYYYSSNLPSFNNQSLSDPNNFIFNSVKYFDNLYNNNKLISNYMNKLLNVNAYSNIFYYFCLSEWPSGVQLSLSCIQPDILDDNKWIEVCSVVNLSTYFSNAGKLSTLSPEYILLVNMVSQLLFDLESTNWNNAKLIQNIWAYTNITNIDDSECLYSGIYPNWTNQLISNCFIPNSNMNVQDAMSQLFNDIYLYYPSLTVGELAFSTSNINGTNILSVCKIDNYNGKQCIKEVRLNLQLFVEQNNIIGDTIFNGNINIKNYEKESIIVNDNVTKKISINSKLGINQGLGNINALLDIDNLSNTDVLAIINKIASLNNISYITLNKIISDISSNLTGITDISDISDISLNILISQSIPPVFINDIIVFKTPIMNRIEPSDIEFISVSPNAFIQKEFSDDSFLKIQTIVNEINRMSYEIDIYVRQNTKILTFSFVEILNDKEYNYLASIKTIITNSQIYFVASISSAQPIMINPNYKNMFVILINAFSSLNRLINYSILVMELPEIYSKLLIGDSVNSFTQYVQNGEFSDRFGLVNGEFIFCNQIVSGGTLDKTNMGTFLFTEQYPERGGKLLKNCYLKNSGITCDKHAFQALTYYKENYGLSATNQNFITHYVYESGEKISFINKINIEGSIYVIGAGINVNDYIDPSILLSGDNQITGSLVIKDILKTNIFEVNTEYNKIVHMFNTGFGTNNPQTIIDVKDSGLTNFINFIKDTAMLNHTLNLNYNYIKNLDIIDASNIEHCINTQFIDPLGTIGSGFIQNKDRYCFLIKTPNNDNPNELFTIYNWLYRNWDDSYYTQINDNNNKTLINTDIQYWLNEYENTYIFDNAFTSQSYNWVFGAKLANDRLILKNGIYYSFGIGLNIGNYNLNVANNTNVSKFFSNESPTNLLMQNLIIRYKDINITTSSNYALIQNTFQTLISTNAGNNFFTINKIIVDFNNPSKALIYEIDFKTLSQISNLSNQTLSQITDTNYVDKYRSLFYNIIQIYSLNNTNTSIFNKDDFGIINFEDDYVDFFSSFYCVDISGNLVTLISFEFKLNDIMCPSVSITGDCRINGDTYFCDANTNIDFVAIDTNQKFLGIGSNVRWVNYKNSYDTTTRGNLSQQHFVTSGSVFPISTTERFAEIQPERDAITNNIINYPENSLVLFSNKTTLSARRSSKYYSINEMKEMAKLYTTTTLAGPHIGQQMKYRYGSDINFEILDNSRVSREIGNIHMVIDDISNNNILAGFGVSVLDTGENNSPIEREIMYVNNNGVLNIDKITLGTDTTDISNNILLAATNNDLMINNVSLTEIINNKINSMFSVDNNGNLNINFNGKKYYCHPV